MERISAYNYKNPRLFLLDSLNERQKRDPHFSVRAWARELGLGSHTFLLMLLNGKRPLRLKHLPAFSQSLGIPSSEQLYLQALVQYDSAETEEERKLYSVWLAELHPGKQFKTRELEEFLAISDPTYTAITVMTELKGFTGSAREISRRLNGKLSPSEAQAAVQRLKDLGLIAEDSGGKLRATYDRVTTRDDVANEGARKYHRSSAEAAARAVEELPLDRREFQSFSLAIRKDKVPLAKEMIRRFRAQLAEALGANGDGEEVYQTNIQFFQLTESPARATRAEDEGVELTSQTRNSYA